MSNVHIEILANHGIVELSGFAGKIYPVLENMG
jgi:hypothetical protein